MDKCYGAGTIRTMAMTPDAPTDALNFEEILKVQAADAELAQLEDRRRQELAPLVSTLWKGDRARGVKGSGIGGVKEHHAARWVLGILGVALLLGLVAGPLFYLNDRLATTSSNVVSDLTQFSHYEQGQSANNAAVARVERNAHQTKSGGVTVWAEASGNTCWGVVVSGGSASSVEKQAADLC